MDQLERAVARAIEERGPTKSRRWRRRGAGNPSPISKEPIVARSSQEVSAIERFATRTVPAKPRAMANNRVVAHVNDDPVANVFGVLRTQVLRRMRDHQLRTLAILGPTASVGKSTVAVNLAVSMARDVNQTVLLVDLDLHRPRVAECFGIKPEIGIGEYLEGKAPLEAVLVDPALDRLVLLPARGAYPNAAEMLTSTRTADLVAELRNRYDDRFVLFDLPPLLGAADALSLLPHIDCALLVVEEGRTTREEITECKRLLAQTQLVGAVVNKGAEVPSHYFYTYADTKTRRNKR